MKFLVLGSEGLIGKSFTNLIRSYDYHSVI